MKADINHKQEVCLAGRFRRLAGSSTVLIAACLLLFEVGVNQIQPLRYFNHTGLTTIRQNFLVSKLPEALSSPNRADVLILGSSLILVPAVRCDDELHSTRTRYDRWYTRNHISSYVKADYLQDRLADIIGKELTVSNLSVAASMVSDQYLILKKYLASGKRPGALVVSIAPRDFLDNQRKEIEKTATYSILADFTCLGDLLESRPSPQELGDFVLGTISSYYKDRADYSCFFQSLASYVSGHPATNYAAARGERVTNVQLSLFGQGESLLDGGNPVYETVESVQTEIDHYKEMYLPINMQCFNRQTDYLDKLLSLAEKSDIPTLVIDMPLTEANLSILPETTKKEYQRMVRSVTARHECQLIVADRSRQYFDSDFEDCAHMNAKGGKKLFDQIAVKLADPSYRLGVSGEKSLSIVPEATR